MTRRRRSVERETERVTDSERLAAVAAASRSGASARESWREWGGDTAITDEGEPILARDDELARDAIAAARLAHESGVPLADLISSLARVEAVRENARSAVAVAMAGPRASARLLGWLPVAGLVVSVVVEPRTLAVVATTGLGWGVMAVAAGLMAAGRRWMTTLLRTASAAGEVP